MASGKGDMKGYFRQKKAGTSGGISKSKRKPPASAAFPKKSSPASLRSDILQPSALTTAHGSPDLHDEHDEATKQMLREFDMNMVYGPCIGISRIGRWDRASRLGLNPPREIESLLKSGKTDPQCIWDGRV